MSMTSLERVESALKHETPDRVPVNGMGWTIGAFAGGHNIIEYAKDGEKMGNGQLAFIKKTGVDIVNPTSDVGQIAEGWGTKMKFSEKITPLLNNFAVNDPADWENLEVLDPLKDGRMNVTIKACEIVAKNSKTAVLPYIPSPLTSASHARSLENVMIDVMTAPDLLHEGLKVITQTVIDYIAVCMDVGAHGVLYAPTRASAELFTLEQYKEFGLPYDEKVLKSIKKQDAMNIHHVCGLEPFFEELIGLPNSPGINWWDRGSKVDLVEAKEKYGKKACLVAGLDQTNTLMYGTPEEVEAEAKDAIEKGKLTENGFILSPGCEIAPETPFENMKAAVRATEKYGQY